MRRAGPLLRLFGLVALLALVPLQPNAQTGDSDQSTLAKLISSALSTPTGAVHIGRIDGALSSDATIYDLRISDRDGDWLKLDRARMVWSRTALFSKRLQIDKLEVGRLEVLRKPRPQPAGAPPPSDAPILPELPVKVVVGEFKLAELSLGKDIAGEASRWSADGKAELGAPAEGLNLVFGAKRLDHDGTVSLNLRFVPQTSQLDVSILAREAAGGMVATLAELPGNPPVSLDFKGSGPLDSWTGRLDMKAGERISAKGDATVRREGAQRRLQFQFDSQLDPFLPPVAAKFVAGVVRLDGDVTFADDGLITANRLGISAPDAGIAYSGTLKDRQTNGLVAAEVRGLDRLDPRIRGRLRLDAKAVGPIDAPVISGTAKLLDAVLAGRPVQKLDLTLADLDLGKPLDARIALDGAAEGRPVKGRLRVAKPAQDIVFDELDLSIGTTRLAGKVALSDKSLAEGTVTLDAPDLSHLSAFALGALSGAANAKLVLDRAGEKQNVQLVARAGRVSGPSFDLRNLDINARIADALRQPLIDGSAGIDRLMAGSELIEQVRLNAKGEAASSAFTAKGRVRGFAVDAEGKATTGEAYRIDLTRFTAARAGQRIALARPTTVTIAGGGARLNALTLAIAGGTLTVNGAVGAALDVKASARKIPLTVVDLVAPGTGLAGTLDADVDVAGTPTAPRGSYNLNLRGFSLPQTRGAGVPPIDVAAKGRLEGERASLDATATLGKAGRFTATGSVPLKPTGALDLTVRGHADAALANRSLGDTGRTLAGRVAVDARISGPADRPAYAGSVTVQNATFTDAGNGLRLTDIDARLVAENQRLTIDKLAARTRNGGTLALTGGVTLDPAAGFPGQVKLKGTRAELVNTSVTAMVADLDLDIAGPMARRPSVSGTVNIVSMDVNIPESFDANLRPLTNVKHLNASKALQKQLAAERKAAARAAASPFVAALNLHVRAANRIFVRGRGIDAELDGDLRLAGTSANPVATGAFDLRRGRLVLLTQRLDFTSGRMTFSGGMIPELDFRAEAQADAVTATVNITGPANKPVFEIGSNPQMPRDEVLARLLFRKPTGSLSPVQAIQIATAVAHLSGLGADADIIERARRALGVDTIDIGSGPGGPTVGASRYISRNVSVGVKTGADPAQSAVTVDVDVTRRIRVQGEVGADGRSSIGAGVQWEW